MDRNPFEYPQSGGRAEALLDVPAPQTRMHLVLAGGFDPAAADTWSGTPSAIVAALRAQGHRVSTIGSLQKVETGWPRLKAWWQKRVVGKTYIPGRDLAVLRRRTAGLAAALRALEPCDAVITWSPADAAIMRATVPHVFIHDATWRCILDFYPRYDRRHLAPSMIRGGEALDRAALANCARAIYSSRWAADAAHRDYATPSAKLVVAPFGANLPSIPTDDELGRAIVERGRGACRLLFVGTDWQRKGGDIAVAIARRLNERGIACQLDVVGTQLPAHQPNWLRVHGFLSQKDPLAMARLAALFTRADFLVLPSRADCTPIVLNEAAAYGLPTATTAVGGIPELVGDSGWAKAFPLATQASGFAEWIETCYRDRSQYVQTAWLGRREYSRRLNWAAFARTLTAAVAEVGSRKPGIG